MENRCETVPGLQTPQDGSTPSDVDAGARRVADATASVSDWTCEIKRIWSRGSANTLELAKVVCAARTQLHRGQWAKLWKSDEMPFSKRKADILVVIGRRWGMVTAQTCAHLPAGWNILYQLAQLAPAIFENLLQAGTIHPKLTLREAKDLVALFNGSKDGNSRSVNIRERLQRFTQFVRAIVYELDPEARQLVTNELTLLIEQISNPGDVDFRRTAIPRPETASLKTSRAIWLILTAGFRLRRCHHPHSSYVQVAPTTLTTCLVTA